VWGDATLLPLKDRPVRFFSPFLNHEDTPRPIGVTKEKDRFGLDIENGIPLLDTAADIWREARKPSS
jgi:hypothetical protein